MDNSRRLARYSVDDAPLTGRLAPVAYPSARRGRTILTAAIASTPTCRGGSFGPFHARARIIAAVTPLLLDRPGRCSRSASGRSCCAGSGRATGSGGSWRSTPVVSIAEARALAEGPARYVAIRGRIDAEDEFEDDAHRPLVLRRARIQLRRGSGWGPSTSTRGRGLRASARVSTRIAIDHAALDAGLVVVPRESVGTAADAPDRVPAGTPARDAAAPAGRAGLLRRARDRGRASRSSDPADGAVRMTAGLGRPLILTTLERDGGDARPRRERPAPTAGRGPRPGGRRRSR